MTVKSPWNCLGMEQPTCPPIAPWRQCQCASSGKGRSSRGNIAPGCRVLQTVLAALYRSRLFDTLSSAHCIIAGSLLPCIVPALCFRKDTNVSDLCVICLPSQDQVRVQVGVGIMSILTEPVARVNLHHEFLQWRGEFLGLQVPPGKASTSRTTPVLSCPVLSCPVLSCPVLSWW